ncbi:putative acetyltransferase [Rubripirellula lacrimiformis]|uniref:Putative acetyltransferase n=2 Tax=Rubripirellula lacrimiformis TaxID=1930273 RepID=A0A517NEL3_9BACT|nr:putative acetyltransferase [Rubripirellula lacrimiformis]
MARATTAPVEQNFFGEAAVNPIIRKANHADPSRVWEIRRAAILSHCAGHYPDGLLADWTSGEMADSFVEAVVDRWWVATVADEVVGTGTLDGLTGQIDAIFVHPSHMGMGIGRQMMGHLESVAITAGLTRLTLDSTLNAAAFYRRCGFVGQRRGMYQSPRGISLPCIPMQKQLRTHV